LIGPPTVSATDIRDHTHFFGEVDPSIFGRAFAPFREKLFEYEKVIGAREHPPLKAPINWRSHSAVKGVAIEYALQDAFNEADTSGMNVYFAKGVVWREQDRHFVCPLLRVDRRAYESHYRLKSPVTLNNHSTSLLDLTINQILWACSAGLRAKSGDEHDSFTSKARNAPTDSARAMMSLARPINLDLFGDCNAIAALRYESRGGTGAILIAQRGHANVRTEITFRDPINLSHHRMARKVLEMSKGGLSLLSDGHQIYGLGGIKGTYTLKREDLFVVEFVEQDSWRLRHGRHEMMVVTRGQPRLPSPRVSKKEFRKYFQRRIGRAVKSDLKLIYRLVEAAINRQKHGALLVISDNAEGEASRLGGQVEPFPVTVEKMQSLTAIDGAVLIDPAGRCHGVGAILDGQAVVSWDASRGSRYNSALRYVSTRRNEGHQCLAVVISEDGMINLL
jgi:hypothetical protein